MNYKAEIITHQTSLWDDGEMPYRFSTHEMSLTGHLGYNRKILHLLMISERK